MASAPTQSLTNLTFYPKRYSNSETTGNKEFLVLAFPLGLPKWDIRTKDLGFSLKIFLIEGIAPKILVLSLIYPSLTGTLKSTLIKTL